MCVCACVLGVFFFSLWKKNILFSAYKELAQLRETFSAYMHIHTQLSSFCVCVRERQTHRHRDREFFFLGKDIYFWGCKKTDPPKQ